MIEGPIHKDPSHWHNWTFPPPDTGQHHRVVTDLTLG